MSTNTPLTTFPPDLLLLDWSTHGTHPAIDATVERIRTGGGTVAFRNERISALALQHDLRESGLGPAPAPAPTPAPDGNQLVQALDRQFVLESGRRDEERQRREEDRRRHDRESDQDSAAMKAYLETFELLYGNTRYPVGDVRRGGDPHHLFGG